MKISPTVEMLPTLPSRAPPRVHLPGVTAANRMRVSSVQKQRNALFFDQRMERRVLML